MQLTTFFKLIFTTDREGIVCVATRPAGKVKGWGEKYFNWPAEAEDMDLYIQQHSFTHDVWFCPQLLTTKKRDRSAVGYAPTVWADLDTCDPGLLLIEPTIVVKSSVDKYQAYWLLEDEYVLPSDVEDLSRRIAYFHKDDGADISGWDLSQLLRVPTTRNFKYDTTPVVTISSVRNESIPVSEFLDLYPEVAGIADIMEIPMPTEFESAEDVLMRHRGDLNPLGAILFAKQSDPKKRSTDLWKLECVLFEGGLSPQEVYSIVYEAHCNKYEQDGRDPALLWRDVLRAKQYLRLESEKHTDMVHKLTSDEPLLTEQQRYEVEADRTIIEDYIEWASIVTDASEQYHAGSAFMLLSALLSSRMTLDTQFGKVIPNLWFMILADTTLTRKTTAMQLAMEILADLNDDALLATDGSVEGIFGAMATRPGKTSVFHRDEFAGLLKGMVTKEYLSGMAESFTQMYDGKRMKRILRKESFDIRNPVFIMFTGGIKTSILGLLTRDQVESGFVPRFVFITAEAELNNLRPLGPPTTLTRSGRMALRQKFAATQAHYINATETITVGTASTTVPKNWKIELTDEAWTMYNKYAAILQRYATEHEDSAMMMPCMTRLGMSGLKCACLLAAARENHENKILVSEADVVHAFYYVEEWRGYLFEVLEGIGKSPFEKLITAITNTANNEKGIPRGTIMRRLKLSAREADQAIATAEQRMLISVRKKGDKTYTLWPFNYVGDT